MSVLLFALELALTIFALTSEAATVKTTSVGRCEASKFAFFIADDVQCDKYFRCENTTITEQLCDDGLVFNPSDQMCIYPQKVDCTRRPQLQPPKGFGNCSRLNGMFAHSQFCDQYFYCNAGSAILVTCPLGLIFDPKTAVCEYPDVALRPGCMPEDVLQFTCPVMPKNESLAFGDHLRFPHPKDCRYFFKCLRNGYPRLGGCEEGKVYNRGTGFCDRPKNVKGCENYYKDDDDEFTRNAPPINNPSVSQIPGVGRKRV